MNEHIVDSNLKQLSELDIVIAGAANTGITDQLNVKQLYAAITAELAGGHSIGMRQGNTLFIINNTENPGVAMFRALNADTPRNYVENSKMFIKAAQMAGYHTLITQFTDPRIAQLLQTVKDTGSGYYDSTTRLELTRGAQGFQAVIFTSQAGVDPNAKSQDPNLNTPPKPMFARGM